MNAKRFFYLAAGVLCLTLAFAIGRMTAEGPQPAFASIVDHDACDIIAFDDGRTLDVNGTVWTEGWQIIGYAAPPVPVADIRFWSYNRFLTFDSELWVFEASTGWVSSDFWPGGPTPAEKTTWSELKSNFR